MSNKSSENVISPAEAHMIPLTTRIKQEKLRWANDTINRTRAKRNDANIKSRPAFKRSLVVMVGTVCWFRDSTKKLTIAVADTDITKHAIFIAIFNSASWFRNFGFRSIAFVPSCSIIIWVLEICLLIYIYIIFYSIKLWRVMNKIIEENHLEDLSSFHFFRLFLFR